MRYVLQVGRHPLGIQPSGNYLFDSTEPDFKDCRQSSLGTLAHLSDELIYRVLGFVDAPDLAQLARSSKALYAWSHYDELWKHLVIKTFPLFEWHGRTWRETFGYNALIQQGSMDTEVEIKDASSIIRVEGYYSDFLFQPWMCVSMEIRPEWLMRDNIDRRSDLSIEDFIREYETPNIPVIISDATKNWGAMKEWTEENLLAKYGNVVFRAEAMDASLDTYFNYARNTRDETPFYLFDKFFMTNCPDMAEDYQVPAYFQEDLFRLLGDDRPDYRWLIIGPARSGSSFHKDPNGTSAWNATITGSKKWILIPPHITPPGVFSSADGSEVMTPASLMEWFMNYYSALESIKEHVIECITRPGDLIFVPSGWWHTVINLESTTAITQNYVSERNLVHVVDFLKTKKDQISGLTCCEKAETLGEQLEQAFEAVNPGRLADLRSHHYSNTNKVAKAESGWWSALGKGSDHVGTDCPDFLVF